jgi:AcrR family transcriptional regulator
MAASIEAKGYRETTVADVVRIARTSRRTFYQHFADRDACFLALFEQTAQRTIELVAAAVNSAEPWDQQIDRALDAYIESVTQRPALQLSFVRELPGLAGVGAVRQRAMLERFAQMLVDLVESSRRGQPELEARPLPLDVAIIIVGGLRELLVHSIEQGRDLHELRDSSRQVVRAILAAVVF